MNLKNVIVSKISQAQRDRHHMDSLIPGIEVSGTHRSRENGGCQRVEWGWWMDTGEKLVNEYQVSVR
jgi:hypothetical protein